MLCNQHGTHLTTNDSITGSDPNIGSTVSEAVLNNYVAWESGSTYVAYTYNQEKTAYTVTEDKRVATPKAAYILNEMQVGINNYGLPGNYARAQKAWYELMTSTSGSYWNDLAADATAYDTFVKKIAKNPTQIDSHNSSTYKTKSHTFSDGTTATIKFPEIDKSKLISSDTDKVTVNFNTETQQYVIGPIKIKYAQGSSNGNKFGGITGMKIYTDASSSAVADEKWSIIRTKADKTDPDFPDNEEEFYIALDYIEGATKITNIKVDYQYLVAGANYSILSGTYTKYSWKRQQDSNTTWENGNYKLVYSAKNQGIEEESQQLVFADSAARWYEKKSISILTENTKKGSLKITKVAKDENGNTLTADEVKQKFGDYQYFDFKVKVTHADGSVDESIETVRAGESVITTDYSWGEDEEAPTYEVEEIPVTGNTWTYQSISNEKGSLKNNKTVEVTAVNKVTTTNTGTINLTKTRSGKADTEENFYFDVVVTKPNGEVEKDEAHITIAAGQETGNTWSKTYEWYGEDNAKYEITENIEKGDAALYPNTSITAPSGEIGKNKESVLAEANVNAFNFKDSDKQGYIVIKKDLSDGQTSDEEFTFNIKVEGVKNTESGVVEYLVTLKAGETYKSDMLLWEGDTAPSYTVEEISKSDIKNVTIEATGDSTAQVNGNTVTGHLISDGEAEIISHFTNKLESHSGKVKVVKDVETPDKVSKSTLESDGTKFEISLAIEGTFQYEGQTVENSSIVITKTLPDNGKWEFESSEVTWYGDTAPTFTVTESNLPTGWKLKTFSLSDIADKNPNEEGQSLIDGKTIEAKLVNELPEDEEIDLTFSMAGIVWVDNDKNDKDTSNDGYNSTKSNGVYDKDWDILKENAEVTVYKVIYDQSGNEVSRTVATAYKDANNNEISFPLVTKSDGKWNVARISVPAVSAEDKAKGYTASYDVEFAYDGQTYEPVEFLSYKVKGDNATKLSGTTAQKANEYKNASTSDKSKYAKDSMALETSNNSENITEVSGKTAIDANGDTTGIVTLADGTQTEVTYSSENAGEGYPVISTLNTTNSDGKVLDIFKATARTSAGNLTFPFDVDDYDGCALTNTDKYIDENGIHNKYSFLATYNYCLNINLGLKERETVDVGLTKNLDTATVVVKEKMYQYKYSGYYDLTEYKTNTLNKDIKVDDATGSDVIEYTLGLYKSDYYYRAEMYNASDDESVYTALTNFYSTISKTVNDTEMDIYLTYKIKVQNNSEMYKVRIDSIDDYYDSSFTLVTNDATKYLKTQTVGGTETDVNAVTTVANASDYSDKWTDVKTGIVGSDKDKNDANILYNKMTASGLGIELTPGENKELTVTFKVNKEDNTTAKDSIILGLKSNVAEIASYATFDLDGNNAGKLDRDSAPGNVNISTNNSKSWYEDDTFAAPKINVNLVGNNDRNINGTVWEDNSDDKNTENPGYNQQVGNGQKDSGEESIEGITTELVEKVAVKNDDGTYTEYNYIWPTDTVIDALNGETIEKVSGFDSTTTTNSDGNYTFNNVAAGDYVVKFTYGDKEIDSKDYSTANYYNGQDYKSTTYKANLKTEESDHKVKVNNYLDIDKYLDNNEEVLNTAVDNEVRRLAVIDNSRTITYENNKIMAAANNEEYKTDHMDTLLKDYYMYAETAKLDMNIETTAYAGNADNENTKTYNVKNISFGIEERPITKLSLDKQIEEIILTTTDGNNIMDAKYNISYNVADDGEITANVELDTANSYGTDNLQALNRDAATNQGFRYINVDSEILQGTTITVKYRFTVLNTGEVDRTGSLVDYDYNKSLKEEYSTLADTFATYTLVDNKLTNNATMGSYVGDIYYYGVSAKDNGDAVVKSTVRQLVDYIDNDAVFDGTLNASKDTSWSQIDAKDLNELIKEGIVTKVDGTEDQYTVLDENQIQYQTANGDRNNLVTSVDNANTDNSLNNSGFIVELQPYVVDKNDTTKSQASMTLTTTRYVGSDSDDLQIDNIAEIIKYNNRVGRRDELTITGNTVPAVALTDKDITTAALKGTLSAGMKYERDTSATEVITLSPPTGSGLMKWKLQVLGAITGGLVIIVGGIVLIKKKILK